VPSNHVGRPRTRWASMLSHPLTASFISTRCRYAEMYRAMGLAELGALLSCNRDGAFCEGYDPRLKLERTQTLMGGASHCDFRYRWEETPAG
jgi:L-2-amino-thiazoline-4-carboxylic acid hydrolase